MKKIIPILILCLITLGFFSNSFSQKFKHPGLYASKDQLDFVKKQVKDGKEPWKSAFDELKKTNPTAREPKAIAKVPRSATETPEGRRLMDEFVYDGSYAQASALLFYFTGEQKYADHAIKILNAWSIFQDPGTGLWATWAVPHYMNAAELMKHTPGTGWKDADIKKFDDMARKYMWKWVGMPASQFGTNAGCTAVESQVAIAIYLDDQKLYKEAIDNFNWLLPRFILMNRNKRYNGETPETCRDLNHTKLIIGIMHAAQYAWNQGTDLWKPNIGRWAAFAELHAGIMTGDKPAPSDMCEWQGKGRPGGVIYCKGGVSWGDVTAGGSAPCNETAWEILYNHINRRLGRNLPITRKMLERNRPLGSITKRANKWETLVHANINPADIGVVTPPKNQPPTASFTTPTNSKIEEGYSELIVTVDASDPENDKIDVLLKIDGKEIRSESVAPYEWGQAGSPNPSETIGLAIGDHVFEAIATDAKGLSTTISKTITVTEKNVAPTASFTTPIVNTLEEGYPELVVTVDATDPNGDDMTVVLKIDGNEIRSESVAPYEWGHAGSPNPLETVGLAVGDHVLEAIVSDAKGLSTTISKTIAITKKIISGQNSEIDLEQVYVFPNPSNSGVFKFPKKLDFEVFDATGVNVLTGKGKSVDLSGFKKGTYYLRLSDKTVKLVTQ